MLAGHYGPAYLIKARYPQVPLWQLFLAVQLVDVFFFVFAVLGIETLHVHEGAHGPLGMDLASIPYTHSLLTNLLYAGAFIGWGFATGKRKLGLVLGVALFSHFFCDIFVHLHDLPLFPWPDSAKIGFGWWHYPLLSAGLELALVAVGYALFRRTVPPGRARRFADIGCAVLVVTHLGYAFGPTLPTVTAMAIGAESVYIAMTLLAWGVDRRLNDVRH